MDGLETTTSVTRGPAQGLPKATAVAVWLPTVPGVRIGSRWRRERSGVFCDWPTLQRRIAGLYAHRGRCWTEGDIATMRDLQCQTWGVVEIGRHRTVVQQWMRQPELVLRTGEVIELTRNARAREMLAWVWAATEAGAGGVLMTREQWCEVLTCSPRSIYNYQRELERKGLVRLERTLRPAERDGSRVPGSWDGPTLMRLGPALDGLALALYERPHVRYPQRSPIRRHRARALAASLRVATRIRGGERQAAMLATRERWRVTSASPPAPAAPSTPPPLEPPACRPSPACVETAPAPYVASFASLPAPPPPTGERGELRSGGAKAPVGAEPTNPTRSARASGPRALRRGPPEPPRHAAAPPLGGSAMPRVELEPRGLEAASEGGATSGDRAPGISRPPGWHRAPQPGLSELAARLARALADSGDTESSAAVLAVLAPPTDDET